MKTKDTLNYAISGVILFTIIFGGWQIIRLVKSKVGQATDNVVYDQAWAQKKQAEIEALESQVVAAKDAIARLDSSMKTRLISRSDDREEFNKLNEKLLELETQKSQKEAELRSHK